MSRDESLNVLQRHGAAAEAGDLDAVMADYTDESVLI